MASCGYIKPTGDRCRAQAMAGYEWCYVHNPAMAEKRKKTNRMGGKRGGKGRPRSPQGELAGVKAQLQNLADQVLKGEVERGDAAVCGQLLNVLLRAHEQERKAKETEELEARLEALETQKPISALGAHRG